MAKIMRITLLLVLALFSFQRNGIWKDDGALWTDTTIKAPSKARGYNELGLYTFAKGRYAESLQAFSKAIRLNPYLPASYLNIGLAHEKMQQIDLAVKAYEWSISLDPYDPTPCYNLGLLYYNVLKDRGKALHFLLKARDLNPGEPDVHNYLGLIYRDQGNTNAAQKEFTLFEALQ